MDLESLWGICGLFLTHHFFGRNVVHFARLQETLPESQRCQWCRRRAVAPETVELPAPSGLVRACSGTDPSGAPTRFVPEEGESNSTSSVAKGACYPVELIQTFGNLGAIIKMFQGCLQFGSMLLLGLEKSTLEASGTRTIAACPGQSHHTVVSQGRQLHKISC